MIDRWMDRERERDREMRERMGNRINLFQAEYKLLLNLIKRLIVLCTTFSTFL